jgi:hypothetical protein
VNSLKLIQSLLSEEQEIRVTVPIQKFSLIWESTMIMAACTRHAVTVLPRLENLSNLDKAFTRSSPLPNHGWFVDVVDMRFTGTPRNLFNFFKKITSYLVAEGIGFETLISFLNAHLTADGKKPISDELIQQWAEFEMNDLL